MKWSDLTYNDFYIPYDENKKAIRGFWLTTQNVNLESLPKIVFEPFNYYQKCNNSNLIISKKVFLTDIVGTSYKDYGDMPIIESYMKIKRACEYISNYEVTRKKYLYMLKKEISKQCCPIILSQNNQGEYFVDGNGNHRIVMYKMMMLTEIAEKYDWACGEDYDLNYKGFNDIRKKYWLNVNVKIDLQGGDNRE